MVIIHQMAKVGSTAIQQALQRAGIESLQTHNLGEHHLQNNLASFLSSFYTLQRVRNELGLFKDQIIATKLLDIARQPGSPKQKLITLSRDPARRWFSALIQNYAFLQPKVDEFYEAQQGKKPASASESFDYIFTTLLNLVNSSEHKLGSHEFNEFFWNSRHTENEDINKVILLVGAELLVPFTWFQTNIHELIDLDIYAQPVENGMLVTGNEHFKLLYIKFENLKRDRALTSRALTEFLDKKIKMKPANVSKGKAGFDIIKPLEDKYYSQFMSCANIKTSDYCRHFNYPEQA